MISGMVQNFQMNHWIRGQGLDRTGKIVYYK